jgi:hypothetical protein
VSGFSHLLSLFDRYIKESFISVLLTIVSMSENSEESDDSYTVSCPYCGETFQGESQMEAKNKEGVHRTQEHVQDGEIERVIDGKNSEVDDWRRQAADNGQDSSKDSNRGKTNGADRLIDDLRSSREDDEGVA